MLRGVRVAASSPQCLSLTRQVARAAAVVRSTSSRSSTRPPPTRPTRRRLLFHSSAAVRASLDKTVDDGSSSTSSEWTPPAESADSSTRHDETAVSEHAVLSTFDLFSIGIGPSSSVSERRGEARRKDGQAHGRSLSISAAHRRSHASRSHLCQRLSGSRPAEASRKNPDILVWQLGSNR